MNDIQKSRLTKNVDHTRAGQVKLLDFSLITKVFNFKNFINLYYKVEKEKNPSYKIGREEVVSKCRVLKETGIFNR